MTISKLATALTVVFVVSAVVLIIELLLVLRRHRRSSRLQQPNHFHTHYYSTKKLLYFLCLKSQTRVEPSGAPTETQDGNGSTQDDPVIDVCKLLEVNGPSRFLCTIKEEDSEYVDSTSISGAEVAPETIKVSLQACFEAEATEEKAVMVDMESVVSSPCDSPVFYTPMGSPARDGLS
ncbi:hypothetical protein QVD17_14865 [Tagetes erecta]|uniref:Uncharacterized protein n=1 Tax=Tagetes erecta TaxID=13708 RepID=A0AAD8NZ60_TARER|nr:hypothetical protein QVD17_14865 [Tagetes erecta]